MMNNTMNNKELTNAVVNLDNRVSKLEKENNAMKNIETSINVNIDLSKMFDDIKSGKVSYSDFAQSLGIKVTETVQNDVQKISEEGYVHNVKTDGRWAMAQMFEAMKYVPRCLSTKKGYNDSYSAWVRELDYHYQFEFLADELHRLAKMEKENDPDLKILSRCFNRTTVYDLMKDYIEKLGEYIKELCADPDKKRCDHRAYVTFPQKIYKKTVNKKYVPATEVGDPVMYSGYLHGEYYYRECGKIAEVTNSGYVINFDNLGEIYLKKGNRNLYSRKQVDTFSGMVFVDEIQQRVLEPLCTIMDLIGLKQCTYRELESLFKSFMEKMPVKFHNEWCGYCLYEVKSKSKLWIEAFKKRGAYMTASNMIKCHGCRTYVDFGGAKSIKESLNDLNDLMFSLNEYEGYKMLGFLRELIMVNDFDWEEAKENF